jgi:hypothetical protein
LITCSLEDCGETGKSNLQNKVICNLFGKTTTVKEKVIICLWRWHNKISTIFQETWMYFNKDLIHVTFKNFNLKMWNALSYFSIHWLILIWKVLRSKIRMG